MELQQIEALIFNPYLALNLVLIIFDFKVTLVYYSEEN